MCVCVCVCVCVWCAVYGLMLAVDVPVSEYLVRQSSTFYLLDMLAWLNLRRIHFLNVAKRC